MGLVLIFFHRGLLSALLMVGLWSLALPGQAQKALVQLGQTEVGLGQPFTITLSAPADVAGPVAFPEIAGMRKAGTSTSSSTTISNGVTTSTFNITQSYIASKEGTYTLRPFVLRAAGQAVQSRGASITVSQAQDDTRDPLSYDPFEDFFSQRRARTYVDVKEEAFLALQTDKQQVYVGEGFNVRLSLLVAESNQANMDFYNLPNQLSAIIKKIKPTDCWEENFNISDIEPTPVRIGNKLYREYKIYQSSYFPLNAKTISFPAVSLQMLKYRESNDPFFDMADRAHTITSFATKAFAVRVRELPPNPIRASVAVGDFRLEERLGQPKLKTGQSTSYQFIIKGEGNISAIEMASASGDGRLDVYPPSLSQNILRSGSRVTGIKTYTYLLQPREPGAYALRRQGFIFPFFNPRTGRYDSLVSRITLQAAGASVSANQPSVSSGYDEGAGLSNQLISLRQVEGLKVVGNIILLGLTVLLGVILLAVKSRNR